MYTRAQGFTIRDSPVVHNLARTYYIIAEWLSEVKHYFEEYCIQSAGRFKENAGQGGTELSHRGKEMELE